MPLITSFQVILLIGPTLPLPAPALLTRALERMEITHSDDGPAGIQLVFKAGRSQPLDLLDDPLLRSRLLKPFSRIVVALRIGVVPRVLFDGVITNRQFTPAATPGESILAVTGEDLSLLMDMEERIVAHPAQSEPMIATKIIARYARYGLVPLVVPPPTLDLPLPTERVPVQHGSDLAYLKEMAARYAYDFYLTPGPLPGAGTAYWGPPKRLGLPQRALSINMGASDNLASISFRHDALAPQLVTGRIQDRRLNKTVPVQTFAATRAPLARQPALSPQGRVRTALLPDSGGMTIAVAHARAQASTDRSVDAVVLAVGELDIVRYGGVLEPRRTVGVRGVGDTFDGLYYVRRVTSEIIPASASFRQHFTLAREGTGALSPLVLP